jgi:hypothetical protein
MQTTPPAARRRRIDTLTDAERATFPAWTAKWVAVGHRTGALDEGEWRVVEAAYRAAYGFGGLRQPRVLGVSSPLAACVAAHVARRVCAAKPQAGVGAGVRAGVRDGVGDGVWAGVRDGVWAGVRDLLAPYESWLHEPIRAGLADARESWTSTHWGGNLWCDWEAYASWFCDVGHLDLDLWDRLQCSIDMATAGPAWLFDGLAVVSDRPTVLHVETVSGRTRMHCEDGPAIAWADGWALHFWHGIRVPADLIETGWSADRILQEPNTEIRRCAIERIGWDQFIRAADLPLVDTKPDPANAPHVLRLCDVPRQIYGEAVRVVLMTNGSPDRNGQLRVYGETVPADIDDAVAAVAWQYGIDADTYSRLQRRT